MKVTVPLGIWTVHLSLSWGISQFILKNLFVFDMCRDITNMYKEPPPGLHIAADEDDITKVCAQLFNN